MIYPNFLSVFDVEAEREKIIEEFKTQSGKLDYVPLVTDDVMVTIEICLRRMKTLNEALNVIIANNYIQYSTGDYLDALVALLGLTRIEATLPTAQLKFTANSPTFLAKGTKLHDGNGHTANLMSDLTFTLDALELTAYAQLDEESSEDFNTIQLEVQNIYIDKIQKVTAYSGYKVAETDDELRTRFQLALHQFSTAGTAETYLFYVLSTSGVNKAKIINAGAGVVEIIYDSELADEVILPLIKESVEEHRPLTDNVIYKRVEKIAVDLELEIAVKDNSAFAVVNDDATNAVTDLFANLSIAESCHASRVIDAAFCNNSSIKSIIVNTEIPTPTDEQILILNSLKIYKA